MHGPLPLESSEHVDMREGDCGVSSNRRMSMLWRVVHEKCLPGCIDANVNLVTV